jgi:hypothetical protein
VISLAEAARLSSLGEEQILREALAGKISLCVHSPSWARLQAKQLAKPTSTVRRRGTPWSLEG